MEPLGSRDYRLALQIIQEIHACDHPEALPELMMSVLARAVPSDCTSYTEINPLARKVRAVMDSPEAEGLVRKHVATWQSYMHQHPLLEYYAREPVERAGSRKLTDFLSLAEWKHREIYNEFYRHFGLIRQMVIDLPVAKPAVVGVALNRSRRDFSERDRAMLDLLRPHLACAYRKALLIAELGAQLESCCVSADGAGTASLVTTCRGRILQMDAGARRLISKYFPAHARATAYLPPPLREWLAAQRAQCANAGGDLPAPPVYRTTHERDSLSVHLTLQPDLASVRLVLSECVGGGGKERLEALGLTDREAEVLCWLARGQTNREIGGALHISPRTVQKHLEHIFEKLRVETRTAAAVLARQVMSGATHHHE